MKKIITPVFLTLFIMQSFAADHITMSLNNCVSTSPNTIQFDLFVVNDGTTALKLNSLSYGVNINAAILTSPTDVLTWAWTGTSGLPSAITGTFSLMYSVSLMQLKLTSLPSAVNSATAPVLPLNTPVLAGTFIVTNTSNNWASNSLTNLVLNTTTGNGNTNTGAVVYVGGGMSPTSLNNSGTRTVNVNCNLTLNSCSIAGTAVVTNVGCFGASTGAINLSVAGGTPSYLYTWSNGTTTQDISGLASATYTVTITDAGGCSSTGIYTVTSPSAITITKTKTNVLCNGAHSGSINTTVAGGTSPYSFVWSNGATTQNISGLSATVTYTITVTDANGCTKTDKTTITQPSAISIAKTSSNVLCNGTATGAINITVTGGTPPYQYLWNNGVTTEDRSSIASGTYTVTVTDANGCTKTNKTTITQPSTISITKTFVNVVCNGTSTGSINMTFTGGTPPYSYLWNNGVNTEDRNNIPAGTYTITITDTKGCTKTSKTTITQNPALTLTKVKTDVTCNGANNGSINFTITGGVAPYLYQWNNGTTTEDRVNLAAGTYTLTVTDVNGCTKTQSTTIIQPSVLNVNSSKTNESTPGAHDGTATALPSGGTSPYSYSWNTIPPQTAQTASGLGSGTYTVTVTDAKGCTKTKSVTITLPPAKMFIPDNENNFEIHFNPNPSNGNITITWNEAAHNSFDFVLTDMTGKIIREKKISSENNRTSAELDLTDLPKGIYIAKVGYENTEIFNKLVIQ